MNKSKYFDLIFVLEIIFTTSRNTIGVPTLTSPLSLNHESKKEGKNINKDQREARVSATAHVLWVILL